MYIKRNGDRRSRCRYLRGGVKTQEAENLEKQTDGGTGYYHPWRIHKTPSG